MGLYEGEIRQIAPQEDPKHVEAWLRLGNPGLHLCSKPQLERQIEIAVDAMQHSRLRRGRELAETLASVMPLVRDGPRSTEGDPKQ